MELLKKNRSKYLLILFLFCVIFYIQNNSNNSSSPPTPKELTAQSKIEINQILKSTPYLWRSFTLGPNDTLKSRIEAQRSWIFQISKTKYIREIIKPKTILVESDISLFYGTNGKVNCPYATEFQDKCEIKQLSVLNSVFGTAPNINGIDAIVAVRNWNPSPESKIESRSVPRFYYILEPPSIAQNVDLGKSNALLASYWRGSDVPIPYREWVPSEQIPNEDHEKTISALMKPKTKMVIAIISDCKDFASTRTNYVNELKKYITVDVYGKCGNFSCPRSKNKECLQKFEKEYKFFLSFENSRCEDYITEKFFDNAMGYNIVPVVMGARPQDYLEVSPSNSFIHVNDFESPEKLAEYLKKLDKDDDLYRGYLGWKGSGQFEGTALNDFFCRVCGMLYYSEFVYPENWDSEKVIWKDVNKCLPLNTNIRW